MRKLFPVMTDRPETPYVILGYIFAILCFWTLPFLMMVFVHDSLHKTSAVTWGEIIYHVVNFSAVIYLFRGYLAESFFNVDYKPKAFIAVTATCAGLMIGLAIIAFLLYYFTGVPIAFAIVTGSLPLAEMELFMYSGNLIYESPVWGTICMVLIVPFTTSLIYYATGFAPTCNKRPWLAYLVVSLFIAVPRIMNAVTFWDPAEELTLYLAQLPFHLIACWGYEKSDTVWAPIFAHMAFNLLSSILIIAMRFIQ